MALSDNQLIFALIVLAAFIIVIAFAYTKDARKNPTLFKGTWKVLLGIVLTFILFYAAVKLSA